MKKLFIMMLLVSMVGIGVFANGEGEGVTVGVTIFKFDDVFMQNVLDAVKAEAKSKGIKVVAADAKDDPVEQLKQVDNFITKGVSAIIVQLVNQEIAKTITKKAVAADIPLVYLNRRPADSNIPKGKRVAVISSPEYQAGVGQAKYVAKRLNGKGKAVILLGTLGTSTQIGRTKGVKDYLAKNTKIKIIKEQAANFTRPMALNVMENWLATGDKFDAVFANNDEMAIGAAKALNAKGLGSVIVVGVDASPDGIAALEAGELDMTMFQNAKAQGSGAVKIAVKIMKGEKFEQFVSIPFEPVTKANAKDYK